MRRASDGPGPWDHIMCLLVDAGAQPVLILPYHRIVRTGDDTDDPLGAYRRRLRRRPRSAPRHRRRSPSSSSRTGSRTRHRRSRDLTAARCTASRRPPSAADEIPAGVLSRRALAPLGIHSVEEGLSFSPDARLVAARGRRRTRRLRLPHPARRRRTRLGPRRDRRQDAREVDLLPPQTPRRHRDPPARTLLTTP